MTIAELIDYLGQFPATTRVVYHQEDMEDRNIDFIGLDTLDYDGDNPVYQEVPHASDCPIWVGEPCTCITAREVSQ